MSSASATTVVITTAVAVPVYRTEIPIAPSTTDYLRLYSPTTLSVESPSQIYIGFEWESTIRTRCRNMDNWPCRYVDLVEYALGYHDGSGPWETPLPPVLYASFRPNRVSLYFRPLYRLLALLHLMGKPLRRYETTGRHIHLSLYSQGRNITAKLYDMPLTQDIISSLYLLCGELGAHPEGNFVYKCRRKMNRYVRVVSRIIDNHYNIVNLNEKCCKEATIEARTNELAPPLAGIFVAPLAAYLYSLYSGGEVGVPVLKTLDDLLLIKRFCGDAHCHYTVDSFYDFMRHKRYFFQSWQTLVDMGIDVLLDHEIYKFLDELERMKDKQVAADPMSGCIGYCTDKDHYLGTAFFKVY